jgi:hypothetical protein
VNDIWGPLFQKSITILSNGFQLSQIPQSTTVFPQLTAIIQNLQLNQTHPETATKLLLSNTALQL